MLLECEAEIGNEARRQWLIAELNTLGLIPQEKDGWIHTAVRNAPGPIENRVIALFLKTPTYRITRSE